MEGGAQPFNNPLSYRSVGEGIRKTRKRRDMETASEVRLAVFQVTKVFSE
jgi:hypothetical protein